MPAPLVTKINADSAGIMQRADIRERLDAAGMDAMKMQPGEFAAYIKSEIAKWSKVVKESGAKPE